MFSFSDACILHALKLGPQSTLRSYSPNGQIRTKYKLGRIYGGQSIKIRFAKCLLLMVAMFLVKAETSQPSATDLQLSSLHAHICGFFLFFYLYLRNRQTQTNVCTRVLGYSILTSDDVCRMLEKLPNGSQRNVILTASSYISTNKLIIFFK